MSVWRGVAYGIAAGSASAACALAGGDASDSASQTKMLETGDRMTLGF